MGRSVEKIRGRLRAVRYVGRIRDDGFRCSYCEDDNAYSDITAIKESDRYFFLLIKGDHAVLRKGCFTVGDEAEFAAFIAEKSGLNVRRTK